MQLWDAEGTKCIEAGAGCAGLPHRTRKRQPGRKYAFCWRTPYTLAAATGPKRVPKALLPATGALRTHMAHPAALHGQLCRLQPALSCTRVQKQRLGAPAGRGGGSMKHGRRLVVAAAEAQERPKAEQQVGPQPLTPLAQVASETANHPFTSLFKIIAAGVNVRRHYLALARRLLLVAFALQRAAAAAASLPTPFPLLCGCHHCVQGCRNSVQVKLQAWRAGPVSRVGKFELEQLEHQAKHRAFLEDQQVQVQEEKRLIEKMRMEREELYRLRQERQEWLAKQPKTADPSAQPPKKAAGPRPAPVEWPPVAEAGAVPGMASSRKAEAAASARPASRRGSTLLPPRSGSGQLRRGTRPTRRWMPPGRRALTHHLCWKRMRRCRRHGRSRRNGSAGAAATGVLMGSGLQTNHPFFFLDCLAMEMHPIH